MNFTQSLLLKIKQLLLASWPPSKNPVRSGQRQGPQSLSLPCMSMKQALQLGGHTGGACQVISAHSSWEHLQQGFMRYMQWGEHGILLFLVLSEQNKELWTLNSRHYSCKLLLCTMRSGPAIVCAHNTVSLFPLNSASFHGYLQIYL